MLIIVPNILDVQSKDGLAREVFTSLYNVTRALKRVQYRMTPYDKYERYKTGAYGMTYSSYGMKERYYTVWLSAVFSTRGEFSLRFGVKEAVWAITRLNALGSILAPWWLYTPSR